jgi:glycosyltransferase involved in cell wall biosynthesis
MRVLMLAQSFAPVIGGEERVVEDLSVELAARGHEVSVATLKQPGVNPVDCGDGIRIHALPSSVARVSKPDADRLYAPPLPDPETVLGLRRVLREESPDVVHAHNWIVHSYLPLARGSGAALVLSLHDYSLICPTKRLLRHGVVCSGPGPVKCFFCSMHQYGLARAPVVEAGTLLRRRTVQRNVDVFLPISSTVAELCRLGPGDTSRLTPNFIRELPPPPTDGSALARLPSEPFVLYFGDLTVDKGVETLLDAYDGLEETPPLVLIGRNYLGARIERPGVHALGPLPYPVAIEALRRSMLTVAPSIWAEPFGMVALQTAKAGKPIVASETGGLRDIVHHEETGLLVPPGEVAPLRSALERLIADEPLRARLGSAAARRADHVFSPDVLVPQVEESYRLAIEAHAARAG